LETYPNDVRVVFMHNPLGFHKSAMPAAKASMAAHAQGKFWEYHDLLFAKKRFDPSSLEAYATELGLDVARFKTDMKDPSVEAKILHDQASMVGHGARGTPAFFVNGKYMSGAKPFGAFKKEIDEAIKAADTAIAGGTSLQDVHRVLAGQNNGATFVSSVIDGKAAPSGPPAKKASANKKPPAPKGPVKVDVHPDDAMKGNPKAAVTIVEFSEYQ
jgi:protein-disulfide isomerase